MKYYFKMSVGTYLDVEACSKRMAYQEMIEDCGYSEFELDEMYTSGTAYRIDQLEKRVEELENKVMQLID